MHSKSLDYVPVHFARNQLFQNGNQEGPVFTNLKTEPFVTKSVFCKPVTYVSPRKQNILQRLWRRLKRDKLRKLAKKLTNAEETIAIDRRWYHKLIWCRGEADPDDFLIEDSFSLPADVRESESLIIADTTLFVVGKQIPTNQTNEECESLRIISSLSDSSSEENNLHTKCCSPEIDSSRLRTPAQINNSNELETVGIGSVVDFPPVENTIFAKRRPLPKIANKGPHPWSHQLTGGEKEQPAPVISKQLTSRPLPKIKDCCSNVTLDETNKSSFDSGIDEFADEVNEEIERAMRAACARNVPAKKENKKREELLLCQTPNLEKGQSGFSWQLDHKLTGPCNRASTPRPQLSSSTLRSMRRRTAVEISLGQQLAKKKRDELIEERNAKINQRKERFQDSQETKELDHEVHKQKLINDQREKDRNLRERLDMVKQKKQQKGSTDVKLALARQRRQQQAKLENQGQKSSVVNAQVSSTKAAGFRSSAQKSKKGFVSFQDYEDTPVNLSLTQKAQKDDLSTGPKNALGSNMKVHAPGPVNARLMKMITNPKLRQTSTEKEMSIKKAPSLTSANRPKISRVVSQERVSSPVHLNAFDETDTKTVPSLLKVTPVQKRFPIAMTMKEAIHKAEEARKERKQREKEENEEYCKEFDKDWNDFYSVDDKHDKIESPSSGYTEYEF